MKISRVKDSKEILRFFSLVILFLALATGFGWIISILNFPETNIVVTYILSVLLTARFTQGYIYGISAAILATGAFNYFFTEPYFTFTVNDPTYLITFSIMTITAIITSALTSKVKQNVLKAQEQEAEASALYQLTNHLTDAADIYDIASISIQTISNIMSCNAAFLCFDEKGFPESTYIQQRKKNEQIRRKIDNPNKIKYNFETLRTGFEIGSEFYDWPIYGHDITLGILRIPVATAELMNDAQKKLLRSMIESIALAMDRFRSSQERIKSREAVIQERYRSNLLRAISHDLRTPLSGIMGTSEILMQMSSKTDKRYELAEDIYKDADWLHSLVENILSLTRLQDGRLTIQKQNEAVEEVISVALNAISKRAPGREISVEIPHDLLLIPMDAKLIEQVLVNLLDNAIKHTSLENEILITVNEDKESHEAVFSIIDNGTGISEEDLPNIFDMFYSGYRKYSDAKRGVGLGLSICESIVKAHGGIITANNRKDGIGAEFIFTLPMEVNND
jgi:two-component system sensor histidine kinase KdpD